MVFTHMHYSTKVLICQLKLDNITSIYIHTCKQKQYNCLFLTSYTKSMFFHIQANIDSHCTIQNWLCFFGGWGRALLYSQKIELTLLVPCLSHRCITLQRKKEKRSGLAAGLLSRKGFSNENSCLNVSSSSFPRKRKSELQTRPVHPSLKQPRSLCLEGVFCQNHLFNPS